MIFICSLHSTNHFHYQCMGRWAPFYFCLCISLNSKQMMKKWWCYLWRCDIYLMQSFAFLLIPAYSHSFSDSPSRSSSRYSPHTNCQKQKKNRTCKHICNIHTHKEIDMQMCTRMCTPHIHMHTQGRTFLTSLLVCFYLRLLLCSLGTPDWGTVPSTIGQVYWHPQIKDKVLQDKHTVHLVLNNLSLTLFLNDSRMCSFQQQHPKQLDRFLLKLYI